MHKFRFRIARRPEHPPTQGGGSSIAGRGLIIAALSAGLVVIAATWVTAEVTHDSVGIYTRDVSAIAAEAGSTLPHFTGAVSMLNLMLWASIASLSLLVAYLVGQHQRWLIGFAALTLFMATDDALMLHESIGPLLGVPEKAFYLAYGVLAAILTYGTLRWNNPSTVPFLVGCAFLAASGVIDQTTTHLYLLEDGVKLLGACVWLTVPILCLPADSRERLTRQHRTSSQLGRLEADG